MSSRYLAFSVFLWICSSSPAFATADGPDHYRVAGVGKHLNIRAEPDATSKRIGKIPANASCVRNLGCQGGLSFEEFTQLPEVDQKRRAEENPRWCKVEYQGMVGWVAGRYLTEGYCTQ
jgi:Bacterial SH3 domain